LAVDHFGLGLTKMDPLSRAPKMIFTFSS